MRIRYRLIHVFIIVAILAIPLAWYASQRRAYQLELEAAQVLDSQFHALLIPADDAGVMLPSWEWGELVHGRLYNPISRVDLSGVHDPELAASAFAYISRFKCLEYLGVEDVAIEDVALRDLEPLENLQILNLFETRLTGATLQHLCASEHLEGAAFSGSPITDEGIVAFVTSHTQLAELFLDDTQVSDECTSQLSSLEHLNTLSMNNTYCTSECLVNLAQLPGLSTLSLKGLPVDDSHASLLSALTTLVNLNLGNTHVSDGAMETVSDMPSLRQLSVSNTLITNEGVETISRMSALEYLNVSHTEIDDGCIPSLIKLQQLEGLDVRGTSVSAEGCARIREEIPTMKYLISGI